MQVILRFYPVQPFFMSSSYAFVCGVLGSHLNMSNPAVGINAFYSVSGNVASRFAQAHIAHTSCKGHQSVIVKAVDPIILLEKAIQRP